MNEEKALDQRAREAEQYAFDFDTEARQQTPATDFEKPKTCNNAGYCYCPKCNPK